MWRKPPGGVDALHVRLADFGRNNVWDIPQLLAQPATLKPPADLFALTYRQQVRTERPLLIHFNTDDYRFEAVWNEPPRGLASVQREQVWAACSPDFSLFADYPRAVQLWNTYRNRWVGCYWQSMGVPVIPTVNWSTRDSYDFCFLGILPGQIVTMRSYTRQLNFERRLFLLGYAEMIQRLRPRLIIWFGEMIEECIDDVPKLVFPVGHRNKEQEGDRYGRRGQFIGAGARAGSSAGESGG